MKQNVFNCTLSSVINYKKNICEQAVNPCFTKCRSNVKQVTRQTPSHLTLKQTPTKPHLPNNQILNR